MSEAGSFSGDWLPPVEFGLVICSAIAGAWAIDADPCPNSNGMDGRKAPFWGIISPLMKSFMRNYLRGCYLGLPALLAQLDLWTNQYKIGVYQLPKALDEKVARLHVEALGGHLTRLTKTQATYLALNGEGPFKHDHYRY